MVRLAGPGLRVLLIGTAAHEDPELPALPTVPATVDDLGAVLVETCGVEPEQIRRLHDPAGVQQIGDAIHATVRKADSVLLIWYVGHGLLDRNGELHLATRATLGSVGELSHRAYRYADLQESLRTCRARTIVVGLDCCFSGAAPGVPMRSDVTTALGGYVLSSAAPEEQSFAPAGQPHTAFTGALIQLLRDGHLNAPGEWDVDQLFVFARSGLVERGLPAPHRAVTDQTDRVVLGPNLKSNPYQGLAAYDEAAARFFHGRDQLVRDLTGRLARTGMLLVVGTSGAGKSSILRAGFIPRMRTEGLPGHAGSSSWAIRALTPGAHPMSTLSALSAGSPGSAGDPERPMVLVVDQLEELFTACPDPDERRGFMAALCGFAAGTAFVVLGLRSDFYPRCAREPWWPTETFNNQLLVPPMDVEQLREVIERPARQLGVTVERGLIERVLGDLEMSRNSRLPPKHGSLPLLSYTLSEMWKRTRGQRMGITEYEELGGIWKAVSRSADRCYFELSAHEKAIARSILPQLVRLGESESQDTLREVRRDELPSDEPTEQVLAAFTGERLIVRDNETTELAHLALAREWNLLGDWVNKDREDNRTRQWWEEAGARWLRGGRPSDELVRGERLAEADRLAATHRHPFSDTARAFLDASLALRRRVAAYRCLGAALAVVVVIFLASAYRNAQSARDDALFERVKSQADQLAESDPSLAAQLTLVSRDMRPGAERDAAVIGIANRAPLADQAIGQLDEFETAAIAADGRTIGIADREHHLQLWRISDRNAVERLGRSTTGMASHVNSVAFSLDGRLLACADTDEGIQLWNIDDPKHPTLLGRMRNAVDPAAPAQPNQPSQPGRTGVITFSPDGHTLAAANRTDNTIRLWNITDPTKPVAAGPPLTGHRSYINAVAFSPDGQTVASASADQTVGLWDTSAPASGGRFLPGHRSFVNALAFSPDGRTLASASGDKTIRLWDTTSPRPASQEIDVQAGDVVSVGFSPDGLTLAAGTNGDRAVRLWNLANLGHAVPLEQPLTGHSNSIRAASFWPDGHTLASLDSDRKVRIWHLPAAVLTGHTGPVAALAYSPDGRTLATGSTDRTTRIWDVADPVHPSAVSASPTASGTEAGAIAFGGDGHSIETNGPNLTPWQWELSEPANASRRRPNGQIGTITFSTDGGTLAVAGTDQSLTLWRATPPATQVLLSQPVPPDRVSYVNAVRFNRTGRLLVHASADRHIRLWDTTDPAQPRPLSPPFGDSNFGYVNAAAFSPDDHLLVTASGDQIMWRWDISDPTAPKPLGNPLVGHTGGIHELTFSPDGRTLASAGTDQTILLWDFTDPTRPTLRRPPLAGHTGAIYALAFSPDGRTLASAGADHTVRIWSLDVERAVASICASTRNVLTEDVWNRNVSPDLRYRPPCQGAE